MHDSGSDLRIGIGASVRHQMSAPIPSIKRLAWLPQSPGFIGNSVQWAKWAFFMRPRRNPMILSYR